MSKTQPLLSIIILSYNTKELTNRCLESIFMPRGLPLASPKAFPPANKLGPLPWGSPSSRHPLSMDSFEIIVVDNASTDGSSEMIRKKFPDVVLIKNAKNVGFGAANNQAVKKARGEYILFLNSDTVVLDSALEKLVNYFQQNKHVNFLGGKLLNEDNSPQASAGPFLSLPVVFLMLFAKGEQLGITRYSPDKPKQVDWISGACILCRKQDFQRLGGFDEDIFLYMEEVELLYRAKQKGMQTWFTPDAQFIHVGSASSREWKNPIMNLYRGLLFFYKKHKSPLEQMLLRMMLIKKSLIGIVIGKLTGNKRILEAYQAGLQVSIGKKV